MNPQNAIQTVTILGSGNVATWLVFVLKKANLTIRQIYSRQLEHAQNLAAQCGAEAIDDLSKLQNNSGLYIFSLKDDAYESVIQSLPFAPKWACSTAGSVSQNVFRGHAAHYGVIYPCQSISRNSDFLTLKVPLCVEGSDEATSSQLEIFAKQLSMQTCRLNEAQRTTLHRAAVFANNFTNALYDISFRTLASDGIAQELLLPIMQNTLDKLQTLTPHDAQTGPARRGDKKVMDKQLESITDPLEKNIYKACSAYIEHQFQPQYK